MKFHLTSIDYAPKDYSIKQGELYSFIIHYPELDLTNWALRAQIRKAYSDSNVLQSFNFRPVIYGTRENSEGNWSTITIYLNASQTSALPVTKNRTSKLDLVKEGINVLVYDVEATSLVDGENVIKIISKSYIEVIGEVTR